MCKWALMVCLCFNLVINFSLFIHSRLFMFLWWIWTLIIAFPCWLVDRWRIEFIVIVFNWGEIIHFLLILHIELQVIAIILGLQLEVILLLVPLERLDLVELFLRRVLLLQRQPEDLVLGLLAFWVVARLALLLVGVLLVGTVLLLVQPVQLGLARPRDVDGEGVVQRVRLVVALLQRVQVAQALVDQFQRPLAV